MQTTFFQNVGRPQAFICQLINGNSTARGRLFPLEQWREIPPAREKSDDFFSQKTAILEQ